jgi:hypothetical protein
MGEKATFHAILAPTQSAIRKGNDTMRVQFEISASEIGSALPLFAMENCLLLVTVETVDA